jgi:hypothetical protein
MSKKASLLTRRTVTDRPKGINEDQKPVKRIARHVIQARAAWNAAGKCCCISGIPAIHDRKKSRIRAAFDFARAETEGYAALASGCDCDSDAGCAARREAFVKRKPSS